MRESSRPAYRHGRDSGGDYLNYAQGQSAICITGAFIWLMSGGGRHHPAWRCCVLCSLWTALRMRRVMEPQRPPSLPTTTQHTQ